MNSTLVANFICLR